jgi:hypothetical protein
MQVFFLTLFPKQHSINYSDSIYTVLGIVSNLEMMYTGGYA